MAALTCTTPLADNYQKLSRMNESDHKCSLYLYFYLGSASSGPLLVSYQPYMAEDGFLPISPTSVSTSREGEATIIHYIDELHSHDNLRGSAGVVMYDDDDDDGGGDDDDEEEQPGGDESRVIPRVMTEHDLEELGFGERDLVEEKYESAVTYSDQFEEDGSGYLVQEDFSDSEEEGFEGRENEISDVQQVVNLNQKEALEEMLPSEVSLQRELESPEEEEESRKHTGKHEEDGRMVASEVKWKNDDEDLVDDGKMTWYFWR